MAESPLRGVYLPTDPVSRRALATLAERGILHLTEMRHTASQSSRPRSSGASVSAI